jgi:undecaprenyl-diphosphatase
VLPMLRQKIPAQELLFMTEPLITFVASFLLWFMLGGVIALWTIGKRVTKGQFLNIIFTCLVAWVLAGVIKTLIGNDRPFMIEGVKPLTLTIPKDGAFPSVHSAVAFGMASSIWVYNRRIGLGYLLLALLVGLGRVASNVHFPLDVLGGVIIGITSAFAIKRINT